MAGLPFSDAVCHREVEFLMTTKRVSQHTRNEGRHDDDVILSVNGVSKKFCRNLKRSLFYGVQDIARELMGLRGRRMDTLRPKEFWALKDISFELRRGEALGLVGKNGSGKSTLLRIIAGLIKPDTGYVEVRGRVVLLIALGAGFSPILTGRENIYANMAILGLTTQEINQRFDAVVEFAEIGEAIDAPVLSYSSGMAARLGFACAIHTEPEVLLIDEVLAVGDINFREKCHRQLQELRRKGTTFVLVSHNNHELSNVCETALYLSKGKLLASGSTFSVLEEYEKELFPEKLQSLPGRLTVQPKAIFNSFGFDISALFFRTECGDVIDSPVAGIPVYFCVSCQVAKKFAEINLYVLIRAKGELILSISSYHDRKPFVDVALGACELRLKLPALCLQPGVYDMEVYIKEGSFFTLDLVASFKFRVAGDYDVNGSLLYQPRDWCIESKSSL